MSKWAKTQRDKSHLSIANNLRQRGFAVLDLASVGEGCPDMLVSSGHYTALVEVKEPDGVVYADQLMFIATWIGDAMFASNADEVVGAFQAGVFLSKAEKDKLASIALQTIKASTVKRPRLAVSKFAKLMQVC